MTRPWTTVALILSAFWVFYNALFSETILYFDSFGYEQLGQLLSNNSLIEYFKTGPNREPLYPLFVCLNMKLADFLHIPYTNLILLTQGLILLLSQRWLAAIFEEIRLSDKITAILVLYFVISPSILRSSLIVYSEIITYPMILAAFHLSCRAWGQLSSSQGLVNNYIRYGFYVGLVFLPLMFTKAIFDLIFPLFLGIFTLGLCLNNRLDRTNFKKIILFSLIAYGVFLAPVLGYKMMNKIYNGNFAFTNRGSWALYGTAAKRILPTTPKEDLAQKVYVFPDKSLCDRWVGADACEHWFYNLPNKLGLDKASELRKQGLTEQEIDRRLVQMSLELMIKHPIKTLNGMFWEGSKLLFWEYPSWGMVILPREIRHVYEQPWGYYVFLFGINIFNLLFFLTAIGYACYRVLHLNNTQLKERLNTNYLLIVLFLILSYMTAHSCFFLSERNALPIVPLFLILIGIVINFKKEKIGA